MSYKPKGVSVKSVGGSQNSYVSQSDKLLTVDSYDLVNRSILAHDQDSPNETKYEVRVNPKLFAEQQERAAQNPKSESATYLGHAINEKMKRVIPAGKKFVAVKAKVVGKNKETNAVLIEVDRVNSTPSMKSFSGVVSLTSMKNKEGIEYINHVFRWDKNGIDLNDGAALTNLTVKIEEAIKNNKERYEDAYSSHASYGFQFRALVKTDEVYQYAKDKSKDGVWEVFELSLPFNWIRVVDDNEQRLKDADHLVTGEEMLEYAEGFKNYILQDEAFEEYVKRGVKFEIAPFLQYRANKTDALQLSYPNEEKYARRNQNKDKNPLYQMSHRKSFVDHAQNDYVIGANAGVNAVVLVTANKSIENNKGVTVNVPVNNVSAVFANNYKGHVHSFIFTSDGEKVRVSKELDIIKNLDTNTAQSSQDDRQDQADDRSFVNDDVQKGYEKPEFEKNGFNENLNRNRMQSNAPATSGSKFSDYDDDDIPF